MKNKGVPVLTEAQEQQIVVSWWSAYCRTKGIDERLLFASYNGAWLAGDARLRAIQIAKAKRMGVRVGVPDLQLAYPKMSGQQVLFHGAFFEMKRTKGSKTQEDQLLYADLLRRMGYNAVIVEGADAAIRAIRAYVEL